MAAYDFIESSMTMSVACAQSTSMASRSCYDSIIVKLNAPTVCLVCGDSASCCHYGVASCGRCKSFFRRYVLGGRAVSCSKGNACNIRHDLKMCAHCRFRKCLTLGMRPEAVNSSFHKHNPRTRLTDVEGRINKLLFSSYFPYSRTNTVRDYLTDKSDLIFVDTYEPVTHWKKPPPGMVYTENSTKEGGNRERLIDPDGTVPYQGLLADSPMVSKVRHSHVLSACVKNKITPEKAALLKTIIALNSAAPNLSEGAREVIEEERLKYVKALMKIVQLESDSVEWLPRFQRLYDMIHLNMTDTQNMMHFFMIEILPLLPKGLFTERIWLELYTGSDQSFSSLLFIQPRG
ncbi:hypothetical protein QR680_017881 [Steinernema hermaphroditum]|uniref:Nuclear receptor domain-containing protein n=1 Tax=Steinernema hermaphroditum TaxID=289476 RepID=A0AA39LPH0_9BILA|nr:hypothetical protein QR680_017881 [Steinernema hermaphroditum]